MMYIVITMTAVSHSFRIPCPDQDWSSFDNTENTYDQIFMVVMLKDDPFSPNLGR